MNPQVETYPVELPGKILYPEDAKFFIKKITPFEQKKFYSDMVVADTISERNKVVIDLIKRLVICENYSVDNLYVQDYIFLLYQIRAVTYKMFPIKIYTDCEECGERYGTPIDVTKLDIETLEEKNTVKTIKLENFGEVPFRYKQLSDDLLIDKLLKQSDLDPEDLFMRILALDAITLSNWKPVEEVWSLIATGEITVEDTAKIEEQFNNFVWGVKEEITCKCPHCGKEVVVPYSLDAADFFSIDNN